MRLVSTLLLLLSLMTTHAVALERAAAKTGKTPAVINAIVVSDGGGWQTGLTVDLAVQPSETVLPNRFCPPNGDCLFLVPAHSFVGMGVLAAYGQRFSTHGHPIRGRLIDRPPIG